MSYAVRRIPVYFVALVASVFIGAMIPKPIFLFGSTLILIASLIFRKEKSESTNIDFVGYYCLGIIAVELVVYFIFIIMPNFSMDFSVYFLVRSMSRINLEIPMAYGLKLRIAKEYYSALYNSFLVAYLSYGAVLVAIYDFAAISPNIPKKPYNLLHRPWWCLFGIIFIFLFISIAYLPMPYLPNSGHVHHSHRARSVLGNPDARDLLIFLLFVPSHLLLVFIIQAFYQLKLKLFVSDQDRAAMIFEGPWQRR